jgi:TatD DNase family protein
MFDSHCHLADQAFTGDLDAVVSRAIDAGLTGALCIVDASDRAECERAAGVAALWPAVRTAVGIHPHRAAAFAHAPHDAVAAVRRQMESDSLVRAIGEIGLDYHYDFAPREAQRAVFTAQVAFAREQGLPVVIHTREADEDTLAILERTGQGELRGVFHCFSGDTALAQRALALGFHVSFSGIVTFPKSEAIRAAAAIVPLERLLVETDCPYLAPVPNRGRRNEPAWVAHTISRLAGLRSLAPDALAEATAANARALFVP